MGAIGNFETSDFHAHMCDYSNKYSNISQHHRHKHAEQPQEEEEQEADVPVDHPTFFNFIRMIVQDFKLDPQRC